MRISGTLGPAGLIFDPATGVLLGYRNPISGDDVGLPHMQAVPLASASGVLTVDVNAGQHFTLTLTENITSWVLANLPASGLTRTLRLRITQHASAAKTVAWPSSFKWVGGAAGAVSVGLSAVDLLDLITFDNGATWLVSLTKAYA